MKYIIDEIELKNLIKSLLDIPDEEEAIDIKNDFLSDKKPVEMIASGIYAKTVGVSDLTTAIVGFDKYKNKSIKIYIGE